MDNKDINNKFRALVRKTIQEGKMNEFFDDEESFGSYDGDFSSDEFSGYAMDVAKQDIGDEFEPLGSSRFEKNLNPEEFKADLTRQNLRLPNDKAEHDRIKKSMDAKKNHEKLFGAGSMNEDGEGQMSKQTIDKTVVHLRCSKRILGQQFHARFRPKQRRVDIPGLVCLFV
jgi:hypothetical protein